MLNRRQVSFGGRRRGDLRPRPADVCGTSRALRPHHQGRPGHRFVGPTGRDSRHSHFAGRIAAVDAAIAADAAETIDARGKLVVPGLIDIHTHTARYAEGPTLVLRDGVTGWIDAGSQGADRIAETIAVARSSPQPGRVLINIGRGGILPKAAMDLARADVGAARMPSPRIASSSSA